MLNSDLIIALEELQNITKILGQVYREKAYKKAIAELKKLPFTITAENLDYVFDVHKVPGVGEGIKAKIKEWVTTGKVADLEKLRNDPKVKAYRELSKIAGVGPATIEKWWRMGVRSLVQLRKAVSADKIILNNMQKYGLRYYDDLNERIPRDEVTALGECIKGILIQLDPRVVLEISGSYRRGSTTSGDIDILVSNKEQFIDDLLPSMCDMLTRDPNFVDLLSEGSERVTFLYRSPVSGKVRQIDVLNIRYPSYGAALLYFTGSWEFNAAMRGYARAKGYRLNQDGLYKYVGKGAKKLELVPSKTEEEIFDILGIEYVRPEDRNEPKIIPK